MELSDKNIIVTGGAGFIGSHLTDKLLEMGNSVKVIDNLSGGKKEFLKDALSMGNAKLVVKDLLDDEIEDEFSGYDVVFHLAANADVKSGAEKRDLDLRQNLLVTKRVLEASQKAGIDTFCFTSTSTVYGNATQIPTPEDYGPELPISLYGASKMASEGYISAYADLFDMEAVIYRFANCVGPRSTHGVTFDFVKKLKKDHKKLTILGDGKQKKSYFHVEDCIDGMIFGLLHKEEKVEVYNVGSKDFIDVTTVGKAVCEAMDLEGVEFEYTGGTSSGAGWKGDVKVMLLSTEKLERRGWSAKYDSEESVFMTAKSVLEEL